MSCHRTGVLTLPLHAVVEAVVLAEHGRHLVDLRVGGRTESVPIPAFLVPHARRLLGRTADVALRATPLVPGPGLSIEVVGLRTVPTGPLARAGFAIGWGLGLAFVAAARILAPLGRLFLRRPS